MTICVRSSNGSGSYDLIMPKFEKFAESRHQTNYYVRGTFTHFNKDFAADVLSLADKGFKQISVEPVVAPASEPYAIQEEDLPELCEQYDLLAKEIVKRDRAGKHFNFFHFMIDLERRSMCGQSDCPAVVRAAEYLAVTPWGDLYPCHQFVGQDEFLMGNVWMVLSRQIFATNSSFAIFMPRINARIVSQNSTVAAVVLPTHGISTIRSQMRMMWDVN